MRLLSGCRANQARGFWAGATLALAACTLWLWSQLAPAGGVRRLQPLSALPADAAMYAPTDSPADQAALQRLLADAGFQPGQPSLAQVLELQRFLGNQVERVGIYAGRDSGVRIFQAGLNGQPLACDALAKALREALALLGYPARLVQLYRSDFSAADTHVLVEARLNDRWLAFDPTFNLTFAWEGTLLGVAEVQAALHRSATERVQAVYHGDRKYPARLDTYYMDWKPLFSNAYAVSTVRPHVLYRLPPLRWWKGPGLYYFGDEPALWARSHNAVAFLSTVLLPLALLFAASAYAHVAIGHRTADRPAGPPGGD